MDVVTNAPAQVWGRGGEEGSLPVSDAGGLEGGGEQAAWSWLWLLLLSSRSLLAGPCCGPTWRRKGQGVPKAERSSGWVQPEPGRPGGSWEPKAQNRPRPPSTFLQVTRKPTRPGHPSVSCVLFSDICTLMGMHLPKATARSDGGLCLPASQALRPQEGFRSLAAAASSQLLSARVLRGPRAYFEQLVEVSHFRVGGRVRGQLECTRGSASHGSPGFAACNVQSRVPF